jgi:8-oxo-dGTP diphosphatase
VTHDRLGREVLAVGPWDPDDLVVHWSDRPYEADAEANAVADGKLLALKERGSPSHDGFAARMAGWSVADGTLRLELEPVRWALRLVPGDENSSLSAMCLVRDADGRWLAGRRAMWVATWQGRWTLGAAGAVEVNENPSTTLVRELEEEWSVRPERMRVHGLVQAPGGHVFVVGLAQLAAGSHVTPDPEHDLYEWWSPDPSEWPDYAEPELQEMVKLLRVAEDEAADTA